MHINIPNKQIADKKLLKTLENKELIEGLKGTDWCIKTDYIKAAKTITCNFKMHWLILN